jgi:RNA polymerase sigma factor (sigma-70 family)
MTHRNSGLRRSEAKAEVNLSQVAAYGYNPRTDQALPGVDHDRLATERLLDRDQLYAEFAPLVGRLIRRFGNNPELRRDLQGEIYYRFCAVLDAFDPNRGVPLRPYLVRQLTASIYSYARQHWRLASREQGLDDLNDLNKASGQHAEADPIQAWIQDFSHQQIAAALPEAMSRLPQRQRQVVIWRYYEERSFEEIAELLSVEKTTARSLLRHGLANLRKYIEAPSCNE